MLCVHTCLIFFFLHVFRAQASLAQSGASHRTFAPGVWNTRPLLWSYWRTAPHARPVATYGMLTFDNANASRTTYDPAFFTDENPDAMNFHWSVRDGFDFMANNVRNLVLDDAQPFPISCAEALQQNAWFLPTLKATLLLWKNTSYPSLMMDPPVHSIEFQMHVLDICTDAACQLQAGLGSFIQFILGNALGHNWPPFQVSIMPSKFNEDFAMLSVMLGLHCTNYAGDSMRFRSDKDLYTPFLRVNPNRYASYIQLTYLALQYDMRSVSTWICDILADKTDAERAAPVMVELGMAVAGVVPMARGADTKLDASDEWIDAVFGFGSPIFFVHVHFLMGHSENTCMVFDVLHHSYPWVIGKGMLWLTIGFPGEAYTNNYWPGLTNVATSLAKAMPVDGLMRLSFVPSPGVVSFENYLQEYIVPNKKQLLEYWLWDSLPSEFITPHGSRPFLVDAMWLNMHGTSAAFVRHNFNITPWESRTQMVASEINVLSGDMRMESFKGERYFQRDVFVFLRNTNDCDLTRGVCTDLMDCSIFGQSSFCEQLWKQCLLKNDDGKPVFENQISIVKENQMRSLNDVPRYHACSTNQPPPQDNNTCGTGYYNIQENLCTNCAPGRVPSQTQIRTCELCLPGRFNRQSGATVCTTCYQGFFMAGSGATECEQCPRGRYANRVESVKCSICAPGSEAKKKGTTTCTPCPQGSYQPLGGQDFCLQCANLSTTEFAGQQSAESCQCKPGFARKEAVPYMDCYNCFNAYPDDGVVCSGFGAPPVIAPNYMTVTSEPNVLYYCNGFVKSCPGGVSVYHGGTACGGFNAGVACADCAQHQSKENIKSVRSADGLCDSCGKNAEIPFIALLGLIFLAVLIKSRPKRVEYSDLEITAAVTSMFYVLPVTQFLEFAQLCSILGRTATPWPTGSGNSFDIIAGIFDMSAFNLPCVLGGSKDNGATAEVLVLNLAPLVLICTVAFVCLPGMLVPQIRRFRPPSVHSAINMILTILQTFFITILNFSLSMVLASYTHPKMNLDSLVNFPYLLTNDEEVGMLYVIAALALSIWCAGTYIFFFVCAILRAQKQSWQRFQRSTVALSIKYNASNGLWLMEDMFCKFASCLVPVIWTVDANQMQALGMLFVCHLNAMLVARPFRYPRHLINDVIQNFNKVMLIIFSFPALLGDNSDSTPTLLCIFADMVWTFLVVVSCLFHAFIKRRATPHDDVSFVNNVWHIIAMLGPLPCSIYDTIIPIESLSQFVAASELLNPVVKVKHELVKRTDAKICESLKPNDQKQIISLNMMHDQLVKNIANGKSQQALENAAQIKQYIEKL